MPTVSQLVGQITIQGADKAKADLQGVQKGAENAGKSFEAAGKSADSASSKIGDFIKQGLAIAGVTLSIGAVVDYLKDAVSAAAELQTVTTQTNSVLRSTGDVSGLTAGQIRQYADSLSSATGVSDVAIQSTENLLLTFTNISGKALPQVTSTVLDMATALNNGALPNMSQLDSISRIVGRALQDPARGMTMLTREGVTLSASQQALVKRLEAAGDMAGAQGVILDALKQKYGGSADAAGNTYAGALAKLGVAFDHIKEAIGTAVLPILTQLFNAISPIIDQLGEVLPPILNNVMSFVQPVFGAMKDALSQITPQVSKLTSGFSDMAHNPAMGALRGIFADLGPVVKQLVDTFTTGVLPVWATIANVVMTNVLPALKQIADAVLANLLPAVMRLVGYIEPVMIPVWEYLGFYWQNILAPAISFLANVLGFLINVIADVVGWLVGHLLPAVQQGQAWFTQLGTVLGNVANTINSVVGPPLQFVGNILGWIAGLIGTQVVVAVKGLGIIFGWLGTNVVGPVFNYIGGVFSNFLKDVGFVAQSTGNAFSALGTGLHTIWTNIASTFTSGVNALIDIINGFLRALDALQINVPSIPLPGGGSTPAFSVGFNVPLLSHVGGGGGISGGGGGGFNLGSIVSGFGGGASFAFGAASGMPSIGTPFSMTPGGASGIGGGGRGGGGRGGHGSKGKGGSSAASSIPADLTSVSQSGVTAAVAAIHAHRGLHGAALDRAILPAVQAAAEAAGAKVGIDKAVADAIAAKDASVLALAAGNRGQLTKAEMKQAVKEGAQAGVSAASKDIAQAVKQGTSASAKTASITLSNDQIDLASQIAAMIAWENTVR